MFGFPKSSRIRHRRDFQETMDHGVKAVCPHVVLFGRARDSTDGPRLGLVVSKKVGESVVRNRVKRRLRESFRVLRPRLAEDAALRDLDLVVLARHGAGALSSAELSAALERCLSRLGRMAARAAESRRVASAAPPKGPPS